jgi:hypothetical protein
MAVWCSVRATLESTTVEEAERQQSQRSYSLQADSRFLERVSWVRSDKEALYRIIKVLNNSNNFLETILVCKPPKDPTVLLSAGDEGNFDEVVKTGWSGNLANTQDFLFRLHDGLRYMNKERSDGMWRLTIQLVRYFNCCCLRHTMDVPLQASDMRAARDKQGNEALGHLECLASDEEF